MRKLGRRLLQRGRASWAVWVTVALFVAAAADGDEGQKEPPATEVTVVVRVSEGQCLDRV